MDRIKITSFILFVAGIVVLWFMLNAHTAASKKRRHTDKRGLKGSEKRIFNQVKVLVDCGDIRAAAGILESSGMLRDAINLLEKHHLIKEAAAILLRISRPNRAAIIYAKHGLYENAANCFELAHMPHEAAQCNRESGDLKRAADNFLKAKSYADAAEVFMEAGEYHEAAKIHLELDDEVRACEVYEALLEKTSDISDLKFNDREIKAMMNHVIAGAISNKFAMVFAANNKLAIVIRDVLRKNNLKLATDLYFSSTSDIGPQLIAIENFTDAQNKLLAQLFINVSNYEYAGMLYERLGMFESAAESFEKADKYARAAYCYERAGKKDKSAELTARAANSSEMESPRPQNQVEDPFALELTGSDAPNDSDKTDDNEKTVVVQEPGKEKNSASPTPPQSAASDGSDFGNFAIEYTAEADISPRVPVDSEPAPAGEDNVVDEVDAPADELGATKHIDDNIPSTMLGDTAMPEEPESTNPSPDMNIDTETTPASIAPAVVAKTPGQVAVDNIVYDLMKKQPMLSELNDNERKKLLQLLIRRDIAVGERVVDFYTFGEGMYFLTQGDIDYYKMEKGNARHVERIPAPEIFGELWLIAEMFANIKIIASNNCTVYLLSREKLYELIKSDKDLALKLYKQFTQKLISRFVTRQQNTIKKAAS